MDHDLLRIALRANAGFSAASALVLLVGGTALADWLGIPSPIVYLVGLALLPWTALAWWATMSLDALAVHSIIVGDVLWVVGSVIVVAGWSDQLTAAGIRAVLAVAIVVAGFAATQLIGVRRRVGEIA